MAARIRHSSMPTGLRAMQARPAAIRASSVTPGSGRYYTTSVGARGNFAISPLKNFGTRLGKGYNLKIQSRASYPDTVGTYLPPVGRDSWTAYRTSDRSLDLDNDIVHRSKCRDVQLYKDIYNLERAISMPTIASGLRPVKSLATIRPLVVKGSTNLQKKKTPVTVKRMQRVVKNKEYEVPRARTEIMLPHLPPVHIPKRFRSRFLKR